MQQNTQAEEDIAKRKEDMLTLKRKEERNTIMKVYKLQQQWRAVLTQTTTAELRDDISVLSQSYKRVLNYKDNIIKSLVADQSEMERSSHLQFVDCLLAIHSSWMAELEYNLHNRLQELRSEYSQREQILSQHQQESVNYESNCNQIKKQNKEEKLWQDMKEVLHKYNESFKDKITAIDSLEVKVKQRFDALIKRIKKLQQEIPTALLCQLSSIQSGGTVQQLRLDCGEPGRSPAQCGPNHSEKDGESSSLNLPFKATMLLKNYRRQ